MPVLGFQLNALNVFPGLICLQLSPSSDVFSLPQFVRLNWNEGFWPVNSIHYEERMSLASFAGMKAACHGSPRAGEALQRQGIPASLHRYSYSAAFLLFRPQFTRFLAHYSSLEREAAGLYVHYPSRCVYQSGLWLATTLPCLPSFAGGESQATSRERWLAIVCGVLCLQFPQCSFVFSHQMSPLLLDFGVYPACH